MLQTTLALLLIACCAGVRGDKNVSKKNMSNFRQIRIHMQPMVIANQATKLENNIPRLLPQPSRNLNITAMVLEGTTLYGFVCF